MVSSSCSRTIGFWPISCPAQLSLSSAPGTTTRQLSSESTRFESLSWHLTGGAGIVAISCLIDKWSGCSGAREGTRSQPWTGTIPRLEEKQRWIWGWRVSWWGFDRGWFGFWGVWLGLAEVFAAGCLCYSSWRWLRLIPARFPEPYRNYKCICIMNLSQYGSCHSILPSTPLYPIIVVLY